MSEAESSSPIKITPAAIEKMKELAAQQNPRPIGMRIGIVGGGCSGFSYSMQFVLQRDAEKSIPDKELCFDGLIIFVDALSLTYLAGAEIDYLNTLEASGFKFNNPNVKSTCGCGQSFSTN